MLHPNNQQVTQRGCHSFFEDDVAGYFTNVIPPESAVPLVGANNGCVSEEHKTVDTKVMRVV